MNATQYQLTVTVTYAAWQATHETELTEAWKVYRQNTPSAGLCFEHWCRAEYNRNDNQPTERTENHE